MTNLFDALEQMLIEEPVTTEFHVSKRVDGINTDADKFEVAGSVTTNVIRMAKEIGNFITSLIDDNKVVALKVTLSDDQSKVSLVPIGTDYDTSEAILPNTTEAVRFTSKADKLTVSESSIFTSKE